MWQSIDLNDAEARRLRDGHVTEVRKRVRAHGARPLMGDVTVMLQRYPAPWAHGYGVTCREATWMQFNGVDDNVHVGYCADGDPTGWASSTEQMYPPGRIFRVPARCMPAERVRTEALVTSVRIERLRDITEESAKLSGVTSSDLNVRRAEDYGRLLGRSLPPNLVDIYAASLKGTLWRGAWYANDFVWVATLKPLNA